MKWASTALSSDLDVTPPEGTPTLRWHRDDASGWRVLDNQAAFGQIRESLGVNSALVLEQLKARPLSVVGTQLQARIIAELLRSAPSTIRAESPMPDDLVDITFEQKPRETRHITARVVRASSSRRVVVVDEDIV